MHRNDPIRVLAVDDDQSLVELTAASLERHDDRLRVSTETDPTVATDRVDSGRFDCVICDYEMPRLDGLEVLSAVREVDPDIPFILFTGQESDDIAEAALDAGVTDYLRKGGPERYDLLANRVTNAVGAARAERGREAVISALDIAEEGLSLLDEHGRFVHVNDAYAALLASTPDRLVGSAFVDRYPTESNDRARRALSTARESGEWEGELPAVVEDGRTVMATHHLEAIGDGRLVCAVRHVSDRRSDERRLKRMQEVTRELLGASAEGVTERAVEFARDVLDLPVTAVARYQDGELVPVAYTEEAEAVLLDVPSFSGERGLAWAAFESGHPRIVDDVREAPETADTETEIRSVGVFPLGQHGVLITGSVETEQFDGSDADFGRLLAASVQTALDRIERERELRERSAELAKTSKTLEAVVEAAPVPIVALDRAGRVDRWNRAAERTFGWNAEEVLGEELPLLPDDGDEHEAFEDVFESVLAGESVTNERVVRVTKSGEKRYCRLFNAPWHEADGSVGGAIGVFLDVTEKREYRKRLSALHETARDLMRAEDREEVAHIASDALKETLGHPLNAVRVPDGGELRAIAVSHAANARDVKRVSHDIERSEAGRAYRSGETVETVVETDTETGRHPGARLYVPVNGHGVLGVGADPEEGEFSESERRLVEVLAANVEAALDRIEREAELERLSGAGEGG